MSKAIENYGSCKKTNKIGKIDLETKKQRMIKLPSGQYSTGAKGVFAFKKC